jgi:glucose-6-phosphate dehydrogenase assembly protein OpcA
MRDELNIETPRQVDPSAIDRELRRMWSEASADTAHPVIRARILNLVIFAEANGLNDAGDAAAELAGRHPSRTIIVAMNAAAAENRLDAEVSARCNLSFGRRQQICSEQIVIRADGQSVNGVHGVVSPLLTSDLRTFLWWRMSGWPQGHSFEVLAEHSDRILLDSARITPGADDPRALLDLIRSMRQKKPSAPPIGDLNWTRLGVWRTALASLYDVPAYRERLTGLNKILISYSPARPAQGSAAGHDSSGLSAGVPIEPLLIAGWLASRLGWAGPQKSPPNQPRGSAGFIFAKTPGVELVLSGVAPDAGADAAEHRSAGVKAITGIQFQCGGESPASFAVTFKNSCLETSVVMDGQAQAGRVVACDDKPDGDLVAEELDIVGNDPVYEDAIRAASTLANLL